MEQRHKILIVDDNEMNTKVAFMALKRPEYDISIAHNGRQALEMAAAADFDIILLDIMMPEMDGFAVCEQLLADPRTANIPIVFLTARTDVDSIRQAFNSGGRDFISKPFQKAELTSRVETQLRLKKHIDEIEAISSERQQLLHILTHDLANPIGASLAVISMVEEDPDYFKEGKAILKKALENGSEIIHFVRKMRALENPEKFIELGLENLLELAEESAEMLAYLWEPKQLRVRLDIDPSISVYVDKASFVNSVVNNLLSNAIKFSHPGDEIVLEGKWAEIEAGAIHFSVHDHGIGIPEDLLENIFSLYFPTNRTGTEGESGTGYGMPLVKRFIEAYGGTISIVSGADGTTVLCKLTGK